MGEGNLKLSCGKVETLRISCKQGEDEKRIAMLTEVCHSGEWQDT